jgi:twitching motility protein PilT
VNRDQLQAYRSAPWTTAEECASFVASVDVLGTEDVLAMLRTLTDRELRADPLLHPRRCVAFASLAAGVRDRALLPHYLSALRVPDPFIRANVGKLLPQVTVVSDHPLICDLLRSPDDELRALAARVLKQIAGKTTLGYIARLLGERDFAGRMEAMALLVPMAGHHAIPALAGVLATGKAVEKRQALRYLADRRYMAANPGGATTAIAQALSDPAEVIVVEAIGAYAAHCTEQQYFENIARFLDVPNPNVVIAAVNGLQRFDTPRVVEALERKLHEGPTTVRLGVLAAMEAIGSDLVVPTLANALGHRTLTVRTRASEILGKLSREGRIDISRTIIYLLRTGDVELRRLAADLARSVSDRRSEVWPKLVRFLRDEDWWVRERVVDALLELAGRDLTPLLSEFVADPSDVVRRFAVEVLARLNDPQAHDLLVRTAMMDTDWWVRERAVEALAAFGEASVVPKIVDILRSSPGIEIACLQALIDLKGTEAAPYVATLLDASDSDVRLKALECLDALQATGQASAVEPLTRDSDTAVRFAARGTLSRWKIAVRPMSVAGEMSSLDTLLVDCAEKKADDLVLSPGRPPYLKRLGRIAAIEGAEPLAPGAIEALLASHLTAAHRAELKAGHEVDFSYEVPAHELRFRANVFRQLGGTGAVFRIVKGHVPDLKTLGLPPVVESFASFRDGLVLVGGPTGSGKSTTLAAIVDRINRDSTRHIISLEDPIEFVYPRRKGLVNQREVGTHIHSTASALRSMLRQDPDVLVVGEMRDLATISFAVTAAETGHLVFGTVHTASADTVIDRIVNAFPATSRDQVRSMLADSLKAVLCQHLIPRRDGTGRVLASEVLLNNEAVANLIRKGKAHQIQSVVATAREQGMQAMDTELRRLVREGAIAAEEAYMRAASKKDFEKGDAAAEKPGPTPIRGIQRA